MPQTNHLIEQIVNGSRPNIHPLELRLPNEESTKYSSKKNGIIAGYAANTNQGIIRNYNEDRVSIILNIVRPKGKEALEKWPKCSFFAIYDGHGGNVWADFLKDNLHQFIVRQEWFPDDIKTAITNGCRDAEKLFFELSEAQLKKTGELDKSGSWAIVVLIVENTAYVANVGDSRAILSKNSGKDIVELSQDHRPDRDIEKSRITTNGGHIYQTQSTAKVYDQNGKLRNQTVVGPLRVFPGRLSVSRTFGDIEAKMVKFGGNPKVVIAEPEIEVFDINNTTDYFLLGWDGIYDKLTSKESAEWIWETYRNQRKSTVHEQIGVGVELVMKKSVLYRTMDNITVVVVAFDGFSKLFESPILKTSKTVLRNPEPIIESDKTKQLAISQDRNERKLENKNRNLSEQATKASQLDSESSKNYRNKLSEDSRPNVNSTFNDRQFHPVRRLDNSIRDAKLESNIKTPVISKSSKIEDLEHNSQTLKHSTFSEKHVKNNPSRFTINKNEESRNLPEMSPNQIRNLEEKTPDTLTNKFVKRTINFNNSRQPTKNSDLKESVSRPCLLC